MFRRVRATASLPFVHLFYPRYKSLGTQIRTWTRTRNVTQIRTRVRTRVRHFPGIRLCCSHWTPVDREFQMDPEWEAEPQLESRQGEMAGRQKAFPGARSTRRGATTTSDPGRPRHLYLNRLSHSWRSVCSHSDRTRPGSVRGI